jgi:hypothetical protein
VRHIAAWHRFRLSSRQRHAKELFTSGGTVICELGIRGAYRAVLVLTFGQLHGLGAIGIDAPEVNANCCGSSDLAVHQGMSIGARGQIKHGGLIQNLGLRIPVQRSSENFGIHRQVKSSGAGPVKTVARFFLRENGRRQFLTGS